jgi:hypothetical protein
VLVEKTSKQEGPVGGTTHEVDHLKQNWRKLTGVVRDGKPRRRLQCIGERIMRSIFGSQSRIRLSYSAPLETAFDGFKPHFKFR